MSNRNRSTVTQQAKSITELKARVLAQVEADRQDRNPMTDAELTEMLEGMHREQFGPALECEA